MLKRHLSRRLKLGTFLGVGLYVHWSFWLLPIALGSWSMAAGEGWQGALLKVAGVFGLFLCVTLHEYGHAMAARRFDVRTLDITLLPIGGLARLERMPRVPWQELVVAVAGPAVNVVIASLVAIGLFVLVPEARTGAWEVLAATPATTIAGWLLGANIMLVLFNMIPAFPMDGGRVLRAVLAMGLEYRRATRIAARIGLVMAIGLAMFGLFTGIYVMVLVATFVGYAGWMESRQVEASEAIRGVRVEEALIRDMTSVGAMDSLETLVQFFSRQSVRIVPVLGVETFYLGMLELEAVAAAVRDGRTTATAADLMRQDLPTLQVPGALEAEISGLPPSHIPVLPVVDRWGHLVGIIDFASLAARVAIARSRRPAAEAGEPVEAKLVDDHANRPITDTYV